MPVIHLKLNNNNSDSNKKTYFLIPVSLCLICTEECPNKQIVYSKCRCDCHNKKNCLKVISDNESELSDMAFGELCEIQFRDGGDQNVL